MGIKCSNCGQENNDYAIYCNKCNKLLPVTNTEKVIKEKTSEGESSDEKWFKMQKSGALMFIIGIILCCTVYGSIIGIPLIIIGFLKEKAGYTGGFGCGGLGCGVVAFLLAIIVVIYIIVGITNS